MASHFASLPTSVATLPFLFARPQVGDPGWNARYALLAAAAAERADETRRNTRGRIAYLLCEFGFQLARRRVDLGASFPLERADIADALGVSLCRVKRTLALLSLSGVVKTEPGSFQVLDWARLCAVASFQPSRLELKDDEEEPALVAVPAEEDMPQLVTRAGDPACFV